MTATESFRAARELLLSLREDYDKAHSEFQWPDLENFNFGLDWFDVLAAEQPDDPRAVDRPRRRHRGHADLRRPVGSLVTGGRVAAAGRRRPR